MGRRLTPHDSTRQRILEHIAEEEARNVSNELQGGVTGFEEQKTNAVYQELTQVIPDNTYHRNIIFAANGKESITRLAETARHTSSMQEAVQKLVRISHDYLQESRERSIPEMVSLQDGYDVGEDFSGNILLYHERHTVGLGNLNPELENGLPGGFESQYAIEGAARSLETDRHQ